MITKDLITLQIKSEGVDKVTIDLDKVAKGIKEIELEAKDAKAGIRGLKDENKALKEQNEENVRLIKQFSAELKQLQQQGQGASNRAKQLSQNVQKLNQDIDNNTTQIDKNNASINTLQNASEALIRTMKIEDMTMNQLSKRAEYLRARLGNISKSAEPEKWKKYNDQLVATEEQMKKVAIGGEQVKSRFDSIGNTIKKVLPLMVAYGALRIFQNALSDAKEFIKKSIEVASKAEGVSRAFNKLNDPNLLSILRRETKGLINDLTLMQSTVRAEKFGIPVNDLAKYLKFAQQRAQETGQSVEYLAESIVNGIGRKSKLIIDNLGISAAQLNDEIKKGATFAQAVTKVVDQELAKQGTLSLTSADKATQASVKWENAQLKVGNSLKWLSDKWHEFSGNVADEIGKVADSTKSGTDKFSDQVNQVAVLETEIFGLAKRYDELKNKPKLSADEHRELSQIMNTLSNAIPGIITEFDQYGNILSINTGKVYEYIEAERARLKLVHKDAIESYEKQAENAKKELAIYKERYDWLKKDRDSIIELYGEEYYTNQLKAAEKYIVKYGDILKGAEAQVNYLTGKASEDFVINKIKENEVRAKFNSMTNTQLQSWIKMHENAVEKADEIQGKFVRKIEGTGVVMNTALGKTKALLDAFSKPQDDSAELSLQKQLELAEQIYRARVGGGYGDNKEEKESKIIARQKKELEIILENLETTHRKRLADIRQKYLTGDIKSESEYNQKIFLQEQAYHLLREQALEEFLKKTTIKELKSDISKQIADQQDKRLDQQVKYQAKLEKIILDANPEEKEKKEYADRLRDLEIYGKSHQELQMLLMSAETEEEKNTLKKKLEALELLEQQHQDNLLKIRNDARAKEKAKGEEEFQEKFGKDKAGKQKAIEDETNQFSLDKEIGAYTPTEAFDAEVELQKKRLALIQEELEARKAAGLDISMILRKQASEEANLTKIYTSEFNRRKQEYSQYGNAIGTVLGNVISGQEDALKGFADVMLDILFDTLTQMINAEIIKVVATGTGAIARSTAEAMAAPDSVLSFGATGFARIAILTAVISGAMMAAKSSLKGLLGGGKSDSSSSTSTSNRTRVTTGFEKGGKIDVVRSQDGRKYSAVYDPDRRGFIDEPTVLVGDGPVGKRKEWVASNPLYENPTARPIIDLLDEAQRSGRVSTIDMNQLMRARMAGFESGGFPSRPSSSLSQPIVNNNAANTRYNTRELLLLNDTLGRVGQILDRVEANGLGVNYQALKETTVKMTEIESYGKKIVKL